LSTAVTLRFKPSSFSHQQMTYLSRHSHRICGAINDDAEDKANVGASLLAKRPVQAATASNLTYRLANEFAPTD
jgi:hypothetical protein